MSSPKIFNGIPRTFLIVSAGTAVALAGAAPGTTAAARAPLAGQHRQVAASAHRARPAPAAGRALRASLAISVTPATARPARYTLTAYRVAAGFRDRARARARSGYLRPRQIAWQLMPHFGWAGWQFHFLNRLWDTESSWNPQAANRYSGAYGIPQAVPGSKMAAAGPDWRWNARTQIRWGMSYIAGRYGSPFGAWQHELSYGWY